MANMLKLITRNFFTKKPTRQFPLKPERAPFERSRGHIVFEENTCILCSICARKCPADAITVNRAEGKWELNTFRCIICGECVNSCPKKSITMSNERKHSLELPPVETHHVEPPKPPQPKPAPQSKPAAAKPAEEPEKKAN